MARPPAEERASSLAQTLIGAVTGLGFKLGVVSILLVSAVVAISAAYAYAWERDQLLASIQRAAATQARLTMTGLEFAMLENNRALLHDLVDDYARSDEVERVFLTDATGHVAVSSAPGWKGRLVLLPPDICPTCAPKDPDALTRLDYAEHGTVLRSMTAVPNEATCHRCHPGGQRMLGVLVVDFSAAPLDEARSTIVKRTVLWGFGVAGVVLLAEWAVVYLGALRRLRALRDAARALASGAGAGRGGPRPQDEIGDIAHGLRQATTALQQTQEQVDQQRRFLVELLDKVDDGVGVVDRQNTVVAANRSFLQRVGATRDGVATGALRCAGRSLCGQDMATECPTRRAFRTARLEKRIQRRADTDAYEEVFASPILGADGRVEFVVETWRDVTERVALQANLARSEQLAAVGTLASGFSHEISTPLGTVLTLIQGLQRVVRDRERVEGEELAQLRARLELASGEVFRCRDITRSLLELGRERRTVRDRVDVDGVLRRMCEVIRPTAEQRAHAVALKQQPGLPIVLGHVDQLEQVMLNLYMNALEAMPGGGELEVTSRPCDGGLEVIVADTGPGVAAEDAARIFQPFFTRKAGGTGLGLYLSRQIIVAHGGRLELDRPGRGARFKIFLPST